MDGIVDSVEDVADLVVGLIPTLLIPMEVCHSVLTAKAVKKYWSRSASFQFPLLCLITTLGATFGGSIMVNFLTFRKVTFTHTAKHSNFTKNSPFCLVCWRHAPSQ